MSHRLARTSQHVASRGPRRRTDVPGPARAVPDHALGFLLSEPLVSDLLEEVYAEYMKFLVNAMEKAGCDSPHGEALCLMSMLEGESLFTGEGRRWEKDRGLVRDTILQFVENRYGKSN